VYDSTAIYVPDVTSVQVAARSIV